MRNERTMNAVALADETDIVCSFIFKNRWAVDNLDKICGPHSSQLSAIGVRTRRSGKDKCSRHLVQGENEPKGSERFRRPTL